MSQPQEEIHIGVRMSELRCSLNSLLKVDNIRFEKSKIANYVILVASLKKMPSFKKLKSICNNYLCRAKIVTYSTCYGSGGIIYFYDETKED